LNEQARVRRTPYVAFRFRPLQFVDVRLLLEGVVQPRTYEQLCAGSALTGREHPLTAEERDVLESVPADRDVRAGDVSAPLSVVESLARRGLLVTDDPDPELRTLCERSDRLEADRWSVYAAIYHFLTKWTGVDVAPGDVDALDESADEFVERYGPSPPPFHEPPRSLATTELPLRNDPRPLFELLRRRKTMRDLDADEPVGLNDLGTILRYVFGCHGYAELGHGVVTLRKTSPSGGALHPVEAYPLVVSVAGLEPGLYHYGVRGHTLELLERLGRTDARELGRRFAAGQPFAANAAVLVLLTARFYRSFWKYRSHGRAYAVLLMDAAHLSQTFYLVCAELGLGAFVTAAINGVDVEDRLGLEGSREGAIAILGCGVPGRESHVDPQFLEYVPRATNFERERRI
jgi:putative peptide maturation dehydrogenase